MFCFCECFDGLIVSGFCLIVDEVCAGSWLSFLLFFPLFCAGESAISQVICRLDGSLAFLFRWCLIFDFHLSSFNPDDFSHQFNALNG